MPRTKALRELLPSRADFVRGSLGAAASLVLTSVFGTASSFAAGRERVAIVGAGIAGITCATILRDGGIDATVFESSSRVGGRMHSEWTYWSDGQHTEWCGAMIDSKHSTMHALARRFGQPLIDTWTSLAQDARDTSYFTKRYYPMTQADRDFEPVFKTLRDQLAKIGPQTTWDSATPFARELDHTSMAQWIERYVPGGRASQLGRLIDDALSNEYGVDTSQQSSLNLVYMLGEQFRYGMRGGEMNVLGYSDQRYTTRNGNQKLPMAMAAALPRGSIVFGYRLTAVRKRAGGDYELTFATPQGTRKLYYDRVVLAIPFIVLRGLDYSSAGFDARKRMAIEQLGYGIHTKLHLQFDGKPWYGGGPWPRPANGQIWTDAGFQNSIDFSLGQDGNTGIIEKFTYGTAGLIGTPPQPYSRVQDSPLVRDQVQKFFAQLDEIWPGVSKHWNGKATFGNAQADPNILASYSTWLVGQCTTIAGYEHVRQGRVHFAGEHTSVEYQGFMEGGASSGVRAAREILADYGIRARAV
ncbi:MAG: FAD-dependent oxidoreductase [Candidatus Eremiobacteraeota bacterium]|nr:FAD-dependent oxidoreductase [Candidatus Eremiobacteraeota bacterium]